MTKHLLKPIALIAAALLPVTIAPAPATAQAATDWNRVVTQTKAGAYVLGNPAAKTKLIEYFSYTCSHCQAFNVDGMGPLRTGWIRRGLVSIEFRNAVRDPYDMTAALLARCGGKARFVTNHEAIFSAYTDWMGQAQTYEPTRKAEMPADESQALIAIAQNAGLSDILTKRGVSVATQRQCLSNKAERDTVLAMTQDAWKVRKISGTPSFVVNGEGLSEVHDWEGLKTHLPALPAPRK